MKASAGGSLVLVKVVPGASRTRIAGVYGERLKVQIAAPPERGRANKELCVLLARLLGVRKTDVSVAAGVSSAQKTVCVAGLDPAELRGRLAEVLQP